MTRVSGLKLVLKDEKRIFARMELAEGTMTLLKAS